MFRKIKAWFRRNFIKKHPPKPHTSVPRSPKPRSGKFLKAKPSLHAEYLKNFREAKINPSNSHQVKRIIEKIISQRNSYEQASAKILEKLDQKVPWYIIASLHNMEASLGLHKQILNGQKISQRTTWVPKGLGPWGSFEDSCVTAFEIKPNIEDWSDLGHVLYWLERFNGWGYRKKGIWSPYLYSFTTLYTRGKYVSDGKFSRRAVSSQCGIVAILKELQNQDIIE